MTKERRAKIRILYVETIEIRLLDIPRALDEMEYDVYRSTLNLKAQKYEEEKKDELAAAIDEFEIQIAISYNFVPTIAQACLETGIVYISWVYDAPQQELYTHYALYPCNYIFSFDRRQTERVRAIGVQHIYHMPLAVLGNKVKIFLEEREKIQYQDEIAFVGQLYYIEEVKQCIAVADSSIQKEMEETIEKCMGRWGKGISIHGELLQTCLDYLAEGNEHRSLQVSPYMEEQLFFEAAVLSRELANRERNEILNTLAEKYDVSLYTYDKNVAQLNPKIKIKKAVSWDSDVHSVFYHSKINLNITLHCIETGIPQRVFDVMAAGGFLISNYQEEIEELFVLGEEIVIYHDIDELKNLVEYYLQHDKEREQIAKKGQEKVLRYHEISDKLEDMLELVLQQEHGRTKSYIELQREFLRKESNKLLAEKDDNSYQKLERLIQDTQYETTIKKTTDLGILREMFGIQSFGEKENLLADIDNLSELEQKYTHIKHVLWRIEQGVSADKCREGIEELLHKKISRKWIVFSVIHNLSERVETLEKTGQYMKEAGGVAEALEIYSYAILLYPEEKRFYLLKAECLLALEWWVEALQTLRQMKNPDEEVKDMISELEAVLYGGQG